jgi:CheY-like chemotaxis protein
VDIGLPTIDGYEVARYVRARLEGEVRLLALTGYGQPQDRQMAAEAGFDAHMVKPIAPPDLSRVLASLSRA